MAFSALTAPSVSTTASCKQGAYPSLMAVDSHYWSDCTKTLLILVDISAQAAVTAAARSPCTAPGVNTTVPGATQNPSGARVDPAVSFQPGMAMVPDQKVTDWLP